MRTSVTFNGVEFDSFSYACDFDKIIESYKNINSFTINGYEFVTNKRKLSLHETLLMFYVVSERWYDEIMCNIILSSCKSDAYTLYKRCCYLACPSVSMNKRTFKDFIRDRMYIADEIAPYIDYKMLEESPENRDTVISTPYCTIYRYDMTGYKSELPSFDEMYESDTLTRYLGYEYLDMDEMARIYNA